MDKRIRYLDGIRGWAAFVVLLFHLFWEVMGRKFPVFREMPANVLLNGPLAVSVFFVLSGDALTTPYLASRQTDVIRDVSLRRYSRLTIPILMSCLMCYLVMKAGLNFNVEAGKVLDVEYWLGGVANFDASFKNMLQYALFDVYLHNTREASYNPFLWTMSIEMLGSLLIFMFLYQYDRLARPVLVCAGVPLLFFIARSFYALFFVGAAFAILRSQGFFHRLDAMPFRWLSWALMGLVIMSCLLSKGMQQDSINTNSVRAAVLLFAIHANGTLMRLLESRLSQFMGRISFPLYLIHFTVIISVTSYGALLLQRHGHLSVEGAVGVGVVSAVVALLVARLFSLVEASLLIRSNRALKRLLK